MTYSSLDYKNNIHVYIYQCFGLTGAIDELNKWKTAVSSHGPVIIFNYGK
jgi:hypothetical protein